MPKRKTSDTPTRVLTFGCLPPDVGRAEFDEQLVLAHRYRNKLIEIERARRAKFREIRAKWAPGLAELETDLVALNEHIEHALNLSRQVKHWERKISQVLKEDPEADVGELRQRIERGVQAAAELPELQLQRKEKGSLAKEKRTAYSELLVKPRAVFRELASNLAAGGATHVKARANRDALRQMLDDPQWPEAWKENARSDILYAEMVRSARKGAKVAPGSYLLVDTAMEASKRDAESDLRFVRFQGEGRIGVQLKNTSIADVMEGKCTFLRLRPGDPLTRPGAVNRPDVYQRVSIRIGSEERKPVWAELPVKLHRSIPRDALIKWAWILVRRRGPRLTYQLQLSVETSQRLVPERRGKGFCAVNFGWRSTSAGLRVAHVVGSDGYEHSIHTDPKSLELFRFCDGLRSASDRHFDAVRLAITEWRGKGLPEPEWLGDHLTFMSRWRSHRKLARIVEVWRDETIGSELALKIWRVWRDDRISKKRDLFCSYEELQQWIARERWRLLDDTSVFVLWLEWWRLKDMHLWGWEADERAHAVRRRRQAYRLEAIELARRYEFFVFDNTDLRKLATRDPDQYLEAESVPGLQAAHQRTLAAPSELRNQFLDLFAGRHIKVDKNRASVEHAGCGGKLIGESAMLSCRCTKCGEVVDRDSNNCKNLLLRAGANPAAPVTHKHAEAQ